jgi:hypothetical protein
MVSRRYQDQRSRAGDARLRKSYRAGPDAVRFLTSQSSRRPRLQLSLRRTPLHKSNRCLVPASTFFEFTGKKYPKAKHRFTLTEASFMAIAGLSREGKGNQPPSFTVLTTAPGPALGTRFRAAGNPASAARPSSSSRRATPAWRRAAFGIAGADETQEAKFLLNEILCDLRLLRTDLVKCRGQEHKNGRTALIA